jgi:hypothetical protein
MAEYSSSSIESTANDSAYLWDVQDILAERTSATTGRAELLVVWKPSWIPKSNMIRDGPVMRRFTEAYKWTWGSVAGDLTLPVEPGTILQQDCDTAFAKAAAKNAASDLAAEQRLYCKESSTPRKSLGGVSKLADPKRKKSGKHGA